MTMKPTAIFLAPGFEELEAVSVIDLLRRADIQVIVVGVSGKEITSAHNVTICTETTLDKLTNDLDAIIFPGGMPGATNLAASQPILEIIRKADRDKTLIAAICASPAVVLHPIGILKGRRATCYPGFEKQMQSAVFSKEKVVRDGHIITSRGPGTAMEFALEIITYLRSPEAAQAVRQQALMHI